MRERFWSYYVELGHNMCFYKAYSIHARRINNIVSGILLVTSAGGIATLAYWDKYPVIWSIVVIISQGLQALSPLFQASKQCEALKYIRQDIKSLFDELSNYWSFIDDKNDEEINKMLSFFRKKEDEIINRFAADIDFPKTNKCEKSARNENSVYFWYHYGVRIEEKYYEPESSTEPTVKADSIA